MNQPLVSIGLPAFKGAHFAEALRSIKNQTYRNIEVIVQDDASPDDLKAIFDAEAGDDKRFSYERNETSTAPNFVRNWQKTIDKAHGEFFVLAGDDDVYEPEFLAEMLLLPHKYPDVDLFFAWHDAFNSQGVAYLPYKTSEYQSHIEWMYSALVSQRPYQAQCGMVRLSALREIGGFVDLPVAWPSDLVTWTLLSRHGVVTSQCVLMHWRYDGQNISSLKSEYWSLLKIDAVLQVHEMWLNAIRMANPNNAIEKFQHSAVVKKMSTGYFDWFVLQEFPRLKLGTKLNVLWKFSKRGWVSNERALRLAYGCIKEFSRRLLCA